MKINKFYRYFVEFHFQILIFIFETSVLLSMPHIVIVIYGNPRTDIYPIPAKFVIVLIERVLKLLSSQVVNISL